MDENRKRDGSQAEALPEPKRRKRWPKVVAFVIVLLVIAGIVVYDRTIGKLRRMKSTWPYQTALKLIQESDDVKNALGFPIRDASFIPAGSVPTEQNPGMETLRFKVAGPKGKADVAVYARLDPDGWAMPKLEVKVPGLPEPIKVDTSSVGASPAPKFDPGSGPGPAVPPKPKGAKGPPGKAGPGTGQGPQPKGPDLKIDIPDLK